MYIVSSFCSENLGAIHPNPKEESSCSLQKTAFIADILVASLLIGGGVLALLAARQVNLGPINVISNFVDAEKAMALFMGGVSLILIDTLLKSVQSKITRLLKEIQEKEIELEKRPQECVELKKKLEKLQEDLKDREFSLTQVRENNSALNQRNKNLVENAADKKKEIEESKRAKAETFLKKSAVLQLDSLKKKLLGQHKADIFVRQIAALENDRWTIEHYQNALALIKKIKEWKGSIWVMWTEKGFQPANRVVESLISDLLEENLKSSSLEELLSMDVLEFQNRIGSWKSPDQSKILGNKLKKWTKGFAQVKEEKEDKDLFKEVLNSVGDLTLAKQIVIQEKGLGKEYLGEKKKFLDAVQQDTIQATNKRYLIYLYQELKELNFDDDTLTKLLSDSTYLPLRVLNNQEIFTEELFKKCILQAEEIKKEEDFLFKIITTPEPSEEEVQRFRSRLDRFPQSYQKSFIESFNLNRNEHILKSEIQNFKSSNSKESFDRLMKEKTKMPMMLDKMGIDVSKATYNKDVYIWMLLKFRDPRWSSKISPENMKELIQEAFNQMVLLAPEVQAQLAKKREDEKFIDQVMQLEPKMAAQILAAMLIQVHDKDSSYGIAEMHRVLAKMISHKPVIGRNLLESKFYFVLIPKDKALTDLKCFDDLYGKTTADSSKRPWNTVRGIGDHIYTDGCHYAGVGEETLLGGKYQNKGYEVGFSTAAHEFWHAIYRGGLAKTPELAEKKMQIKTLLEQKRKKIEDADKNHTVYKGWRYTTGEDAKCSYANSNEDEWGAEFATAFLEANGGLDSNTKSRIATKEQLKKLGAEEMAMFKLYSEILGENTIIPYSNIK